VGGGAFGFLLGLAGGGGGPTRPGKYCGAVGGGASLGAARGVSRGRPGNEGGLGFVGSTDRGEERARRFGGVGGGQGRHR